MREALKQTFQNLWAHKLRSFLTMFGILWGVISVVILSATGEGFRQGNEHVLRELGKNIAIVWGGRTSLQAGGERAGRRVFLTADDARAIQAQSRLELWVTGGGPSAWTCPRTASVPLPIASRYCHAGVMSWIGVATGTPG